MLTTEGASQTALESMIERFRAGDVRKRALTEPDARAADLLLHPSFGYWVSLSREFRERAIRAGYEATLAQAQRLRELHR